MNDLEIKIQNWLPGVDSAPGDRETFAELEILVGGKSVTEIEDNLAGTVRSSILVPALPVARWLILNWWRIRWEAAPVASGSKSYSWKQVHNLASIGGGYAWPALELVSDGAFIRASMEAEEAADMAAIRYLRRTDFNIAAVDFELGVDRFIESVQARLDIRLREEKELRELKEELDQERADPDMARACKLQALAGLHPGEAGFSWFEELDTLEKASGPSAVGEILSELNGSNYQLADAKAALERLRKSKHKIQLDWMKGLDLGNSAKRLSSDKPWDRGYTLAKELRKTLDIQGGPVSNSKLREISGLELPIASDRSNGFRLQGGIREKGRPEEAAVSLSMGRLDNQRFALGRIIATAIESSDLLLPISAAGTTLQKNTRAFAQEFLCPWEHLNAFMEDRGMSEDTVVEAAEYFQVSEKVVEHAIINHGKSLNVQFSYY